MINKSKLKKKKIMESRQSHYEKESAPLICLDEKRNFR